jgi:hypothetical protein
VLGRVTPRQPTGPGRQVSSTMRRLSSSLSLILFAEVTSAPRSGDDRRHAIRSLVGQGVAIGLTICLSRGCLPQRASRPATSSRFSWPRQFPKLFSDRPCCSQYSRCVRPALPPRREMPTPQRSDRFSLTQPEPSHPASSSMTLRSTQSRASPPHNTSRAVLGSD